MTSIQTIDVKCGRKYKTYAFTKSGVYMLMTILKGELAIKQSKVLIRIFKKMKNYIIVKKYLLNKIDMIYLNKGG